MKHRMLLAVAVSAGILVHSSFGQATPPPIVPAEDARVIPPPPTTPPPAAPKSDAKKAKAVKKPSPAAAKPAKAESASVATPEPAVAMSKNVNVRGQANINSEIVTHLKRGELVTVLDEISLKSPKTDEPAKWAKIALPAGTPVWVNAHFVDKSTMTVKANRLRVRSGPGENYSTLGMIDKGAALKELETKGDWIKIESPAGAYAFVAAHLLSRNPADVGPVLAKANAAATPAPPVVSTPPPATVVEAQPPVVTTPVETTPAPPPVVATAPPLILTTPPGAVTPTVPPPVADEPPPKRIVTREGIVRGSASIQAPTYFVLKSLDNNRTINYLHSATTNIIVKEYLYQRILVTGEELLDERWPNVPVIDIETIQTVP